MSEDKLSDLLDYIVKHQNVKMKELIEAGFPREIINQAIDEGYVRTY